VGHSRRDDRPPTRAEKIVITGLLQRPERIAECEPLVISGVAYRPLGLLLHAARRYRDYAAMRGVSRFLPASSAAAEVAKVLRAAMPMSRNSSTPTPTQESAARQRRFRAIVDHISLLADEAVAVAPISEHEFRHALDAVAAAERDRTIREGLISVAERYSSRANPDAAVRELQSIVARVTASARSRAVANLSEDAAGVLADYARAKTDSGANRIRTGHPRLDAATGGGGKRGRLWIIAAYTKDGKTQLAKDLIYHAAVHDRRGCVVITSEQTREDVRMMLTVRHTHAHHPGGLRFADVDAGRLTPGEESVLRATISDLQSSGTIGPISYWQAPGGTTVTDIRGVLEDISRRHPVDVVMVDHTLLFQPTVPQRSEIAATSEVIRELKQLALDFDSGRGVWVLACHQISREGREAAERRGGYYLPRDLAASSEAERSADVVVWLYRDEALRDMHEIRLGVALDRWGPGDPHGWMAVEMFASAAVLPMADA
jgi:replicative DNA helicase